MGVFSSLSFYYFFFFFFAFFFVRKEREREKKAMSGLYNHNFSPARAASPQIRSTNDVDR